MKNGAQDKSGKPKQSEPAKPPTEKEPLQPRDPNSIVRPSELAKLLSISISTLYRWKDNGELPPRIHLAGRAVGWRYGDIVAWLNRK